MGSRQGTAGWFRHRSGRIRVRVPPSAFVAPSVTSPIVPVQPKLWSDTMALITPVVSWSGPGVYPFKEDHQFFDGCCLCFIRDLVKEIRFVPGQQVFAPAGFSALLLTGMASRQGARYLPLPAGTGRTGYNFSRYRANPGCLCPPANRSGKRRE